MNTLRRSPIQRLLGVPATLPPHDATGWTYVDGRIVIDLRHVPELAERSGAVRLEHPALPDHVLVVYGEDGHYHAYRNVCAHGGRRVDPIPRTFTLQCCSVGKSIYDYDGNVLSGPAHGCLQPYPVRLDRDTLTVDVAPGTTP